MIDLIRSKEHKWIFQKNISSAELMIEFLHANNRLDNYTTKTRLLRELKANGTYKGRSSQGSANTMGVRLSELKFYMFGYSLPEYKNKLVPSPMATSLMRDESKENIAKMSLVNLFSMQYPHPFSDTQSCFQINAGRLIVKLLTDKRLGEKMYIDEFCYFVPFIETINSEIYEELIDSILEFRKLNFFQKNQLFKSVDNYDDVFANVFHEFNYYFFRMFRDFGVLKIRKDENHNDGYLHYFNHGNCGTKRNDAYDSGKKCSGYVMINPDLEDIAKNLVEKFSAFEPPITPADKEILSQEDYILGVYQTRPLKYLSVVSEQYKRNNEVSEIIDAMVHASKYGSRDGKDLENALKPVFELFQQIENVSIISGSGDTDLLCAVRDDDDSFYNINVDGKTSGTSTQSLNPMRLSNHLRIHGSKYCIVVSSRFAHGVSGDIVGFPIVAITAQALANYCYSGYNASHTGFIDFSFFENLANRHMGQNITNVINNFVNEYYGL